MRHALRIIPALPLFFLDGTAMRPEHVRQASANTFGIVSRIALPGAASWDHVTAASDTRRLYLAHESHVDVLDLDTDTLVAVIRDTPDVHGVALAPDVGRGYTSNGGDSSLSVFDLKTHRVVHRTRLNADAPDGIAYDPFSRRVFAMHAAKPSLSVVETLTDGVIRTIALGDTPDGAVPDGRGRLFVALKPTSQLAVLDTRRLTVDQKWSLAPCQRPDAIAFDRARNQVVLGCNNRLAVAVDAATGRVVTSFPIGEGVDGLSLDRNGSAIVSCGDGTVHFAQRSGRAFHVTQIVHTPRGAPNSTLDLKRGRVFVPTGALRQRESRQSPTAAPAPAVFGLLVIARSP